MKSVRFDMWVSLGDDVDPMMWASGQAPKLMAFIEDNEHVGIATCVANPDNNNPDNDSQIDKS